MSLAKKVIVFGANGFLGQAICRSAIQSNWEVVGVSRTGANHVDSSIKGRIKWVKGDALKPESYAEQLKDCNSVVHSIGAIMEGNYKQWLNPNLKNKDTSIDSLESVNRDTALKVLDTLLSLGSKKTFVYISASDVMPFIDPKYISSKRDVEKSLLQNKEHVHPIILRPGFMYSNARPLSLPIAAGLNAFSCLYSKLPMKSISIDKRLEKMTTKPLTRGTVAKAVVNGITNPERISKDILGVTEIEMLAQENSQFEV